MSFPQVGQWVRPKAPAIRCGTLAKIARVSPSLFQCFDLEFYDGSTLLYHQANFEQALPNDGEWWKDNSSLGVGKCIHGIPPYAGAYLIMGGLNVTLMHCALNECIIPDNFGLGTKSAALVGTPKPSESAPASPPPDVRHDPIMIPFKEYDYFVAKLKESGAAVITKEWVKGLERLPMVFHEGRGLYLIRRSPQRVKRYDVRHNPSVYFSEE